MSERLWRIPELAKHWGCTPNYIYKIRARGDLPKAYRDARGDWLIPQSDVGAFEARRKQRRAASRTDASPVPVSTPNPLGVPVECRLVMVPDSTQVAFQQEVRETLKALRQDVAALRDSLSPVGPK
jgi:predicted DNA-binding transcriptional regulator AlpA